MTDHSDAKCSRHKVVVELASAVFIVTGEFQVNRRLSIWHKSRWKHRLNSRSGRTKVLVTKSFMPFTAAEIAKHLQGEVLGDPSMVLNTFAPADRAQAGDLTFAENADYFSRADQSAASAIIVDGQFSSSKKILIKVPNARVAFAKALALFFPEPVLPPGVHPTAVIAASAQVDSTAHVGPYCVVG